MNASAIAEAVRDLASRIKTLRPTLWTDPERYYSDRSELANDARLLADAISKAAGIAPDTKSAPKLRVERERGRERSERVIEVINGRRVTVQRSRHSFAISTENR